MQYNAVENKVRIIKNLDLELSVDRTKGSNPKTASRAQSDTGFSDLAESIVGYNGARGEAKR